MEPMSEETLLLNRLRALEDDSNGYYVVLFHTSQLRPANRKKHYLDIAARAFDNLLSNFEATLYKMSSLDFVLMCHEVPVEEMDPVIHKVRQLFSEDPLTDSEDGSINDKFTTWYDLSQIGDFSTFVEKANVLAVEAAEQKRREDEIRSPNALPGERLGPKTAGEISQKLQSVMIEDLIREQTAVVMLPGAKGDVMFREQYVSMSDLQKRVAPNVNLFGSQWLFQFLTETVDRRLLSVLAARDLSNLADSISLNLNISTVLGREFQYFHQKVGEGTNKVIIELQMVDIFADMAAYKNARDLLQNNGYRVLIDGLSPLALQFFDPAMLEADLVKISWGQEFEAEGEEGRTDDMRTVVKSVGAENIILGRTDSEDAIVWALSLGINRFQGYYIDTVVEAMVVKGII
jgi:hypothetical protein